jgi:hypothetical protein
MDTVQRSPSSPAPFWARNDLRVKRCASHADRDSVRRSALLARPVAGATDPAEEAAPWGRFASHLLCGVLELLAALLHVALDLLAATLGGKVGIPCRLPGGLFQGAGRAIALVTHGSTSSSRLSGVSARLSGEGEGKRRQAQRSAATVTADR